MLYIWQVVSPHHLSHSRQPLLSRLGDEPVKIDRSSEAVDRARCRFRVHRLLDAAHVSAQDLDRVLEEMAEDLTPGFFDHLQWEVQQQIEKKNRPMLEILELVVQRACAQKELGQPDMQLLSTLLQIRERETRSHLYYTRLRNLDVSSRKRFASTVLATQMHLEKALLKHETIDTDLLTQLRLISIEMADHVNYGVDESTAEEHVSDGPG